jgi:hypothetical protein
MDAAERGLLLFKLANLVAQHSEELAALESLNCGKTIVDARARKEREQATWINAPAELHRKLTAVRDWEIAHHEERARAYRRRASIAAQGDLLDSPDERRDVQYQREHGDLIDMARRTGRLRQTQDSWVESSA